MYQIFPAFSIAGAAQGIGFATAKAFAEAGASLVLADLDEDLVNKAAEPAKGSRI